MILRLALLCLAATAAYGAAGIPEAIRAALARGEAVEVLVRLEDRGAESTRALKERLAASFTAEVEVLKRYEQLPMLALRVRSRAALERLAARPEVVEIYENRRYFPQLGQSLPLIGQPAAAAAGFTGAGTTVAVIDTAVTYTDAAFGCTSPGVPAGCKVAVAVEFVPDTGAADDNGHGTNVAAIVVGAAPGARIAALDVFNDGSALTSDIVDAVDWSIANRAAYNIVAINLSLGDGSSNASPCISGNPLYAPLQNARAAGILPVAASGNNGHTNGISSPACTPGVVSVGAVYDANLGSVAWSSCTDSTTAADKVTCFSNSGGLLTMLAPGALITAGGSTRGGTSQATPHAAGAAATLRAAFPAETLDQTVARLTDSGVAVTDARNGLVRSRLAQTEAARPANDDFAARAALAGGSGTASGSTALAMLEPGEPMHAGQAGGASVWWTWTAPAAGQARIDTAGSAFGTLLAVYTGNAIAALQSVASSDGGLLYFQAQAGGVYQVAVDGKAGASGAVALNWALNGAAAADLSVTLADAPDPVAPGGRLDYTMSAANAGPQPATNVLARLTLPAGASVASLPAGCSGAAPVECRVALLESGTQSSFAIAVNAGAEGSALAQADVAADTPDPAPANNTTQASTLVQAGGELADADIPALPLPAVIAMALLLIAAARRRR